MAGGAAGADGAGRAGTRSDWAGERPAAEPADAFAAARWFLHANGYLGYRLTGVATTELGEEPSLLPGFGSAVSEMLEAMFVSVPLSGAVSVTMKFVAAPPASVAESQIMTPLLTE